MPGLLLKTDTSRYIRHGKHQGGSFDLWNVLSL